MTAAILAVTIFALMFILIVTEKFELGIGFWRCHARLGCCIENTELRRDRYSGLLVSCRRFRESIDGHQLGYDIFHRGHLPHCGRTVFCFASAQADLQQNCRLQEIRGYPISWRTYCGLLAPATVLVIAMCLIYIYVRYL